MAIDYTQSIPNNVDLHSDRRLQRALENWQPRFLDWWKDMGPDGTLNFDVYLRTAISAEANGWANFGYVKMPDYRWGIFLAGQDPNRGPPTATTRARRCGRRCRASCARPFAA